jgi:hypothetical protein
VQLIVEIIEQDIKSKSKLLKNESHTFVLKDRWDSEVTVPINDLHLNDSTRCLRTPSKLNQQISLSDDDIDDNVDRRTGVDQVVTDLSILEYQLINSVSQRRDPLFIQPEIKETIILDLDQYFEDKSSSFNDHSKFDSEEQPIVEHKPYINEYNRSISTSNIIINGLKEAQMYMFQVYACHDITQQALSDACSLNGIILAIRTKPGDRMLLKYLTPSTSFFLFDFHMF